MPKWDANQYLKFEKQRTQPAIDLAMRIINHKPKTIVDIGCGPGNSTCVLKDLFSDSDILGIDSSANMIKKAQSEYPLIKFQVCDAQFLKGKYDLIFSNACLQWIPNHHDLIPKLMQNLNSKGLLAVQMPMNASEPLFQIIDEVADDPKWGFYNSTPDINKTLTPDEYLQILTDCCSSFEVWQTKYYHLLPDHKSLVEWVKGTRIRPYLERLDSNQCIEFENEIIQRAKQIYPVLKNGNVVLGFRRFFFTAVK